jgi:hypothetical protein
MVTWTQSELNAYEARRTRPAREIGIGVDREAKLHEQISEEVRRRGWIAIHPRIDKPTTLEAGAPDFLIFGDGGRVFLVECKRKGGKLSVAQQAYHAHLRKLGFRPETIYNLEQFLEVICR